LPSCAMTNDCRVSCPLLRTSAGVEGSVDTGLRSSYLMMIVLPDACPGPFSSAKDSLIALAALFASGTQAETARGVTKRIISGQVVNQWGES